MLYTVKVYNSPFGVSAAPGASVDFVDIDYKRTIEIVQMCMAHGKHFEVDCYELPDGECDPEACDIR